MTTPRRIVRPNPAHTRRDRERTLEKLRSRLERERAALARWMPRLKRAFHAVERAQHKIARLERQIAHGGAMPDPEESKPVAVVTACLTSAGTPALVLTTVEVTLTERDNGIHHYPVEGELLEAGYGEPFVHFDEDESPPFLHLAVKQFLGLTSRVPTTVPRSEKS